MISIYFVAIVSKLVKYSGIFGFCPFRYYSAKRQFRVHFKYWGRTLLFWIGVMWHNFIILPTNFIQLYKNKDYQNMSFIIVIIFGTAVANILIGMQVLKPTPFCQGLNAVWRLLETLPKMYTPEHDVRRDRRKMNFFHFLVSAAVLVTATLVVVVALHCAIFPTYPLYVTFNIPPEHISFPVVFSNCIIITYGSIGVAANLAQFFIYAIAYFMFIMPIFRNELKMGKSHYKTVAKFRDPFNLLVIWRGIEIFVVNVTDNEFGFIFVPLQFTVTLLTLFSNVALVYEWQYMEAKLIVMLFLNLLMATIGWALFLHQAGKQYQLSVKVLGTWRPDVWRRVDRKHMTKVRRACRPLWIGDGKRWMIRPVSVLNFLRSLSKNTCRALITFGKVYG